MKNPFDYSISLRVTHPTWSADMINSALDRVPRFSWSVGDARVTPKGTALGGLRSESYCSFDLTKGCDGEIAKTIRVNLKILIHRTDHILPIRSTGGKISFYILWHANGDTGEVLDLDLLSDMVNLGIEFDLNVLDLSRFDPD